MRRALGNLRWYLSLIWMTDRSYFLSFTLLSFALTAAPIVSVLLPKVLLQDIIGGEIPVFVRDFVLLWAAAMLSSFLVVYYNFKKEDLFTGLNFKLKEAIQEKAMTMPFAELENPAALNRLDNASNGVGLFVPSFHRAGTGLMANGVILAFYFVLVLQLQPLLLLLPVINIGMSLYLEDYARRFEHGLRDENSSYTRKKNYLFSLMYDYGYGKEVRLFALGDWITGIYRHYQKEYERLMTRISNKKALAAGADLLVTLLREGFVYLYLIFSYLDGGLSIDSFVLYTGVFASFAAVGKSLVESVVCLADAARQIDNYREFLAKEDVSGEAGDFLAIPGQADGPKPWSVEFDRVSFRYPGSEKYVLKDFSCRIPAGGHVALVGNNGAGKSTVIKLLCGLYDDYEGTIRIQGVDLRRLDRSAYQEGVAAVFQESKVFPATVIENITLQEANTEEETKKAAEALRLMGLWDRIDSLPKKLDTPVTRAIEEDGVELSGGERQNLVICRALYKGGNILLLDEPTAALDALTEDRIYGHFHTISQGRTTIFISHRLNSTRFCDEILLLEKGQVAEKGTHEELYRRNGLYAKLFETQAKYYREGEEEK